MKRGKSDLEELDGEVVLVEVLFGTISIKKGVLIRFGPYKEYLFAY